MQHINLSSFCFNRKLIDSKSFFVLLFAYYVGILYIEQFILELNAGSLVLSVRIYCCKCLSLTTIRDDRLCGLLFD